MNYKILLLSLSLLFLLGSCEEDTTVRTDALVNYEVDLTGEWKLFSVQRNKVDISADLDFSSFALTLGDGTFSLADESFPFPTLASTDSAFGSGNFEFNDDLQPTEIHFVSGGVRVPVTLTFPLYGLNTTSLGFEFSLGCSSTEYEYQFKKQ